MRNAVAFYGIRTFAYEQQYIHRQHNTDNMKRIYMLLSGDRKSVTIREHITSLVCEVILVRTQNCEFHNYIEKLGPD